jgi:predicted nucleic acid-binding protein
MNAVVEKWVDEQLAGELFISTITEAELRFGVAILPFGKRRTDLNERMEAVFLDDFPGRVISFDRAASSTFAEIASVRRKIGRPMPYADAQIAAIAKSHGAIIATRNVSDFAGCGVEIINPWQAVA